jgi:hypothetical protein
MLRAQSTMTFCFTSVSRDPVHTWIACSASAPFVQ